MPRKLNKEKASTIIAEADFYGDSKILARWGITRQTLHGYRKRSREDGEFLQMVTLKKRMLMVDWQSDATKALKMALEKLTELINADGRPEQIHAVAGAVKIVGDLKIAYETLADEPSNN